MKIEQKQLNDQTQPALFEAMVGDIIIRRNADNSIDVIYLSTENIESYPVKSEAGASLIAETILTGQSIKLVDIKNF